MANTSTIVDNFDDNSINTGIWPNNYGTVSETGGRARVTCNTGSNGWATATTYTWDDVYAKLYPPAVASATTDCYLEMLLYSPTQAAGTDVGFYIDQVGGVFYCVSRVSYFDGSASAITYSATTHAWMRILKSGSNILFQTAPDGTTWTTRRTLAAPSWLTSASNLQLYFESGRNNGTNNFAEFDNVNTIGTTPVTKSLDLRWQVLNTISKSSDLRWQVLNRISKSSDLRWAVLSTVTKSSDLRWSVLAAIAKSMDLRWTSFGQVAKSLDLRWGVGGTVTKSLDLRWSVLSTVTKSSDLRWSVLAGVAKSLDLRWTSFGQTTKTLDLRWAILGSVAPVESLAITNFNIPPSVDRLEPVLPSLGFPPQRIINELTGGLVRIYRRVEIYEADATTPFDAPNWDKRLLDGSITVDRERDEKRTCEFMLDNSDRALVDDPYNGFWYDKILKCMWGIRYFDETTNRWRRWETQLGEFMIDRIDSDRFPNKVKVTGRDYAKKCIVSRIANTMSFPIGSLVEDIIIALAANAGITKFAMPTTGQAYTKDLVFTRGTERWEVMKQLADVIGYEVFFRGDGRLTMQPYPDPSTSPLAWSFTQDAGGSLVDYAKSSNDSQVFNHIFVTGATIGGEPDELGGAVTGNSVSQVIFAEAKNTVEGSPTRISRIGDRVLPFESDLFTTVEQAQAYADTMLRISSLEEYSLDFQSLVLPWLDASQIVQIQQPTDDLYTPNRFLLTSFTIPMALGSMSGTARRVTVVGTRNVLEFE